MPNPHMALTARLGAFACAIACALAPPVAGAAAQTAGGRVPAAIKIVVIEGEDAVNIIQQKTAVAPVIEVRDRNDQPVAGAVVSFAVRGGRATFNGARTLTVTTNAAGRAVAAGLTPTGSGALQISATAAFQGQAAAAVTIAQTNVLTAAEAAAATAGGATGGAGGSAGGASGGAGGAGSASGAGAGAGAGGGGLSATTIGLVGAAAAGGVVAAKELGVGGGGAKTYKGSFAGTLLMTFPAGAATCARNEAHNGTLEMELTDNNGSVTGTSHVAADITITPGTCDPALGPNNGTDKFSNDKAQVTGSSGSVTFTDQASNRFPASGQFSGGTNAYAFTFTGTFDGTQVTGTLTVVRTITSDTNPNNPGRGSVSYPVTLR